MEQNDKDYVVERFRVLHQKIDELRDDLQRQNAEILKLLVELIAKERK